MTTILIIEDDPLMRDLSSEILMLNGYDVMTARHGVEGIEMARQYTPDLIVSDINMPEADGFEVFEALQADSRTQTIPFLFLTALGDSTTLRKGMRLGADDFLTKPYEPNDLLASIAARLKRQEMVEKKYDSTLKHLRKSITYALPHEMRTPLMGILGYSEMLKEDYATLDRADILMFAEEIAKAGNRLHRVIENYLAYMQLEIIMTDEAQIKAFQRHLCKLDDVIPQYADDVADRYNRRADLKLDIDSRLGLRMSKDNLGKIITELVDNSLKFSDVGTPIYVQCFPMDNDIAIEVLDKGRGMDQMQIEKIGSYMQFDRDRYEQQGLGLGLAIVIKLVQIHQGTFEIFSDVDKGTTVQLRFSMY